MKRVKQNGDGSKDIFCGIDLHDKTMLAGIAVGTSKISFKEYDTRDDGGVRELMVVLNEMRDRCPGSRVWVAYEASGSGFRLADRLTEDDFWVSVLAPSHLPTSQKSRSQKTDKRDVKRIMDVLRGHVLAGADLPEVWVPGEDLRDHRELVRHRVRLGEEVTKIKNKIHGLLKRNGLRKPAGVKNWSGPHLRWLMESAQGSRGGLKFTLLSLIRELEFYLEEQSEVDRAIKALSSTDDYRDQVKALTSITGVGLLTAMVFLTELGDLGRFRNRRALACYLGLVPRSFESGEDDDRKGHISRMGPHRVRKLLNQAAWVKVTRDPEWAAWFEERTSGGKKDDRKRMITAAMRRLSIVMWHRGLAAEAA